MNEKDIEATGTSPVKGTVGILCYVQLSLLMRTWVV
jgi:hypothetical protein